MELNRRVYLSLVIFGLLAVLLIIFVINPLFNEIKKSSKELISKKQNLDFLENKIENLATFKTFYKNLEPNLEKAETLFVDPEVPVEFISFLEKNSQDCQASIEISPAPLQKIEKDYWPSLTFQITVASSFSNFLKFFEKLENSPYLIKVQNFNIRRLAENELRSKEFNDFSIGDVKTVFLVKVFTK